MTQWQPPEPGDLFDARFRIDDILGSGGFAYVYRAEQLDLGRTVALKVLRPFHVLDSSGQPSDDADSEFIKRFRREAQLVSRLTDPHTITMYEYGRTPEGVSYMSFEYVGGDSMDAILRRERKLAPHRVVDILRQCLQSLQEAHHYGVLHRDIKPANIMLYERMGKPDHVKVLDFGIAKPLADDFEYQLAGPRIEGMELTQAGAIVGTPRYMSPEQLRAEELTPASDLFSLGLVSYELLTGDKAVGGATTMTIINAQLSPNPISLPKSSEYPDGLRQIVNRMVAKSLEDRFQSAAEILDALDHWPEAHQSPAKPTLYAETHARPTPAALIAPSYAPPGFGPRPLATLSPPEAPPGEVPNRRSKTLPNVGIAAALITLAVIGAFAMMNQDRPREALLIGDESSPLSTTGALEPTLHTVIIVTTPSGAALRVNGQQTSPSPTSLKIRETDFPLDIVATLDDGRTITRILPGPMDLLTLDFLPLEPALEQVDEDLTSITRTEPTTSSAPSAGSTQTKRSARKKGSSTSTARAPASNTTTYTSRPSTTEPGKDKKTTESSFPMLDGI